MKSMLYALLLISLSEIKQQTLCVLRVSSEAGGDIFFFSRRLLKICLCVSVWVQYKDDYDRYLKGFDGTYKFRKNDLTQRCIRVHPCQSVSCKKGSSRPLRLERSGR